MSRLQNIGEPPSGDETRPSRERSKPGIPSGQPARTGGAGVTTDADAEILSVIGDVRNRLDQLERLVRARSAKATAHTGRDADDEQHQRAPAVDPFSQGSPEFIDALRKTTTSIVEGGERIRAQQIDREIKSVPVWAKRRDKSTNPVAFVRMHYAKWLGRGLTRSHIRRHDLPLYRAFAVHVHRHPEDAMPELPSRAGSIDEKLERLSGTLDAEEIRKLGLALENRRRRS